MNKHFIQKLLYLVLAFSVNGALTALSIIYSKYWYIFLIPLSLATGFNSLAVISIFFSRLFSRPNKHHVVTPRNIAYIVPCYNESKQELTRTIDSLTSQTAMDMHNKVMIIVCDGRVKGSGENNTTDHILTQDILKDNICNTVRIENAYNCWDGSRMHIDIHEGKIGTLPFLCIVKDTNMGKRDSLVMVRGICYEYGLQSPEHDIFSTELLSMFRNFLVKNNISDKIDYVIGTDADTVFENNCSYELLKAIDNEPNTHGVVGFVSVSPLCPKWSPWTIYQNTEYIVAQCLRRLQQHLVTKKVSCLSGCCQILRVSKETSGKNILNEFNYFPKPSDNIFKQIRSFASEDRNHVCLMLHLYPYVQTRQCLTAWAYTIVPSNFTVFRSQRRRWSLGATCNDLILVYKSGINPIERIGAMINVIVYFLSSFVFASTVIFIISIIKHPNIMMLYLAVMIFVPIFYNINLIWWFPFDGFFDRVRFLMGYIVYLTLGPVINIVINFYSIFNMDVFKWGKTRSVEQVEVVVNQT